MQIRQVMGKKMCFQEWDYDPWPYSMKRGLKQMRKRKRSHSRYIKSGVNMHEIISVC